jgi:hypothetical protein
MINFNNGKRLKSNKKKMNKIKDRKSRNLRVLRKKARKPRLKVLRLQPKETKRLIIKSRRKGKRAQLPARSSKGPKRQKQRANLQPPVDLKTQLLSLIQMTQLLAMTWFNLEKLNTNVCTESTIDTTLTFCPNSNWLHNFHQSQAQSSTSSLVMSILKTISNGKLTSVFCRKIDQNIVTWR